METMIYVNPIFKQAHKAKQASERKVSATYALWQKVSTIRSKDKPAWDKFMRACEDDIAATEYFESLKHLEFVKQ
jgi:hypothetical protein